MRGNEESTAMRNTMLSLVDAIEEACGVRVIAKEGDPYLPKGCFGWSGAYGSHFWIDPTNKIAAVFMKNSKYDGGAANESARNFEKAVYSSFGDR